MADPAAPHSQHALLHRGGPAGTWGNLGLWDHATNYAGACAALAVAVGHAAGIAPGDRVLAIACGAGDELHLWIERFGAATVVGIERDPRQAAMARQQAAAASLADRIVVHAGDMFATVGLAGTGFDHVVCVDAAYHLSPRRRFLDLAFASLRPGGRLACTDLMPPTRGGAAWRLAARACGIAPGELLAAQPALERLAQAGFASPQCEPLDGRVLDGFAGFVMRQTRHLGGDALRRGWRRPLGTALLLRALGTGGPRYGLFSATRP